MISKPVLYPPTNFKTQEPMTNTIYEITTEGFESLVEKRESLKQNIDLESMFVQRTPYKVEGNIAFIDIFGPLVRKASDLESKTGITSYSQIEEELELARNNTEIQYLILTIDSPGGAAMGSEEIADMISEFPIPVFAIVEGTCASAAYKIASSATGIFATKSSQVGSIGTIVIIDSTKNIATASGIVRNIFTNEAAIYKAIGHDFGELSETDKKYVQDMVNASGEEFKNLVMDNRPEISQDVFSAKVYKAGDAITVGLIDGIFTK